MTSTQTERWRSTTKLLDQLRDILASRDYKLRLRTIAWEAQHLDVVLNLGFWAAYMSFLTPLLALTWLDKQRNTRIRNDKLQYSTWLKISSNAKGHAENIWQERKTIVSHCCLSRIIRADSVIWRYKNTEEQTMSIFTHQEQALMGSNPNCSWLWRKWRLLLVFNLMAVEIL